MMLLPKSLTIKPLKMHLVHYLQTRFSSLPQEATELSGSDSCCV